jgi:hypothetical protein
MQYEDKDLVGGDRCVSATFKSTQAGTTMEPAVHKNPTAH